MHQARARSEPNEHSAVESVDADDRPHDLRHSPRSESFSNDFNSRRSVSRVSTPALGTALWRGAHPRKRTVGIDPALVSVRRHEQVESSVRALLTAGWIPSPEHPRQSEADAAVVAGLVAAGATDDELLEIWTTIALQRPKLERAEYIDRTIAFVRSNVVLPSIIEITSVEITRSMGRGARRHRNRRPACRREVLGRPLLGERSTDPCARRRRDLWRRN